MKKKKLNPKDKERILNILRSDECYVWCSGTLTQNVEEWENVAKDSQHYESFIKAIALGHEQAYCTLGAIYHNYTGKNSYSSSIPNLEPGEYVPQAILDNQNTIFSKNDASPTHSYQEAADWIEKNL